MKVVWVEVSQVAGCYVDGSCLDGICRVEVIRLRVVWMRVFTMRIFWTRNVRVEVTDQHGRYPGRSSRGPSFPGRNN